MRTVSADPFLPDSEQEASDYLDRLFDLQVQGLVARVANTGLHRLVLGVSGGLDSTLALLVAILLVLNYTPLGYLQIGPLSASLLTVPVAIGAMTMNPMAGAILGGVFGATSFIQAVEGKSAMGAALFQVSPAGTFVVCFVARVLMGLCTALIFNALRKAMPKNEKLACFLGGLSAPVLNTVFFMGFLVLIFYNCDYVQNLANTLGAQNAFMFIVLLVGVQAIFEWVLCCVVAGAVSLPVRKYLKMN